MRTPAPYIRVFHVDTVSVADFGCYGGGDPINARTSRIDPL